jgi:hypothetical protein
MRLWERGRSPAWCGYWWCTETVRSFLDLRMGNARAIQLVGGPHCGDLEYSQGELRGNNDGIRSISGLAGVAFSAAQNVL